jgi:hypothetical protein
MTTAGRIRRGMTAIVITSSLDPSWIRPLAAFRGRGVATVVVALDGAAFDAHVRADRERRGELVAPRDPSHDEAAAKRARALRHALAEYELKVHSVLPRQALGEALVG